jgi:ribosomal protein S18 acetylase RimI-like enzyme
MGPGITLRAIDHGDDEFLFELFRSAHEHKFVALCWSEEQLCQLLRTQFTTQEWQYRGRYADAELTIILADGEPVGRLYVRRGEDEIVLIDITIAAAHRNRKIGSVLVERLLAEGRRDGKAVRAHVERTNRARRLWMRLGFQVIEDLGIYLRLEQPATAITLGASPLDG